MRESNNINKSNKIKVLTEFKNGRVIEDEMSNEEYVKYFNFNKDCSRIENIRVVG
ncbi:hypothetical protein [Clostridium sp.]|uniref:hypothetical protein n=1 Tax=Clostridium sp. TaxID=1506 RepID=UPI002628ABEC|nr:hypothetical protein [Clostridium sp.]